MSLLLLLANQTSSATDSGTIDLGGTSTAQAPVATSGAVSLGSSSSATAPASGAGAVTLGSPSAAARAAVAGSGTVSLSGGPVTAQVATLASGSIGLGGLTATAAPVTASGVVALGSSVSAAAPATAAGGITLSGTAAVPGSAPTPVAQANGTTTGLSATITIPAYQAGDVLVLIASRNQTEANPFTFTSSLTAITELSNAGTRRLTAMALTPNGLGQTSTTLSWTTSAVFTWWIGVFRGYSTALTVNHAENAIGNATSSVIAVPTTALSYTATGQEVALSAAGVNATATWTTSADTLFATGTAVNGGLLVSADRPTAGSTSTAYASVDRGLNGTARNESALSFLLQATPTGSSANGAMTLGGSVAAAASVAPTAGGIGLGGSSSATVTATASGSISLTGGAPPGAAVASSSGVVTMGGTSTPRAPVLAGGVIVLGGAVTVAVPGGVAGAIQLDGLANAVAGAALRDITLTAGTPTLRSLSGGPPVARSLTAGTPAARTLTGPPTARSLQAGTPAPRTLTGVLTT